MMAAVSAAARSIAWTSDEVWERVDSSLKGPLGLAHVAATATWPRAWCCATAGCASPPRPTRPSDRLLVLRVAVAAAQADARIDRTTLDRLATESPDLAIPWGQETRDLFADLLLTGRPAIDVIETLDQRGLWVRILPEWEPVRSKPAAQRLPPLHRRSAPVRDRGQRRRPSSTGSTGPTCSSWAPCCTTSARATPATTSTVGIEVVARIGQRMGYDGDDIALLTEMVRDHLLLPDVATRRDLSDEGTIRWVANRVGLDAVAAAARRADRGRLDRHRIRRRGATGRPSCWASSCPARPTCSAAARSRRSRW